MLISFFFSFSEREIAFSFARLSPDDARVTSCLIVVPANSVFSLCFHTHTHTHTHRRNVAREKEGEQRSSALAHPSLFFSSSLLKEVEVKEEKEEDADHCWWAVRLQNPHAVQVHCFFVVARALVDQLSGVVRHRVELLTMCHEVL